MNKGTQIKRSLFAGKLLLLLSFVVTLLLLSAQPVFAAKTLNEAVNKAKRSGNGKVISARTVERNNRRIHEVRVLTHKGKVRTMRYPANGANQKKAPKPRKQNKNK